MPGLICRFPPRPWVLAAIAILPGSLLAQNLTGTWQGVVHSPTSDTDQRTVMKIAGSDGESATATGIEARCGKSARRSVCGRKGGEALGELKPF